MQARCTIWSKFNVRWVWFPQREELVQVHSDKTSSWTSTLRITSPQQPFNESGLKRNGQMGRGDRIGKWWELLQRTKAGFTRGCVTMRPLTPQPQSSVSRPQTPRPRGGEMWPCSTREPWPATRTRVPLFWCHIIWIHNIRKTVLVLVKILKIAVDPIDNIILGWPVRGAFSQYYADWSCVDVKIE